MRTTGIRGAVTAGALLVAVAAGCADEAEPAGEPPDAGPPATASTTTIDDVTTTEAPAATTSSTVATGDADHTFGELVDELAGTEEGQTELEQLSLALLVAPSDFADQTYTDNGYVPFEGPNACGIDVDASHPPSVLVGTTMLDGDDRSIDEEIRVYADPAAAAAAYEARRTALDCEVVEGDDPLDAVRFGSPTDVNAEVGADAASETTFEQAEHRSGVIITALVGDAVVEIEVGQPDDVERLLVDREIAAFAVGKILAALEAG